jgi:hypothetical protein
MIVTFGDRTFRRIHSTLFLFLRATVTAEYSAKMSLNQIEDVMMQFASDFNLPIQLKNNRLINCEKQEQDDLN